MEQKHMSWSIRIYTLPPKRSMEHEKSASRCSSHLPRNIYIFYCIAFSCTNNIKIKSNYLHGPIHIYIVCAHITQKYTYYHFMEQTLSSLVCLWCMFISECRCVEENPQLENNPPHTSFVGANLKNPRIITIMHVPSSSSTGPSTNDDDDYDDGCDVLVVIIMCAPFSLSLSLFPNNLFSSWLLPHPDSS